MTARLPVVLISCPNLPFLLGTFDTANFRSWWRSRPFPESIESIKKGMHIYGRSHLVIAQRADGLWAVYRSKNYGIDWERVWLAAPGEVIYDIVLINFGWAIMNTSTGFYETVTAGTHWNKVANLPAAPNAPAFYNIGDGDVLVCTDGRYIWRSTDIARHWTQVCDQQTIIRRWSTAYTGLSKPCIAGANGLVLCAHGPFLTQSPDNGLTWLTTPNWDNYLSLARVPPLDIVFNRQFPAKFLINQVLISSNDGLTPGDLTFIIKTEDLYPVVAWQDANLYSRIFRTYTVPGHVPSFLAFRYMFQQYLSPSEGYQLSAYDLPITGTDTKDKLTFSAQTRIDPATGQQIPSLKYSTDGGATWIDIDITNAKFGDPDGAPVYGLSFLDDNFAKTTWVQGICDNSSWWAHVTEDHRRQCLSYEMDLFLECKNPVTIERQERVDAIVAKKKSETEQLDAICRKDISIFQHLDGLLQGINSKGYHIDRTLEGVATKEQPIDSIVTIDHITNMQADAHFWASPKAGYHLMAMLQQRRPANYSCDTILVMYRLGERLSDMERKFPQFVDIDVPDVPYAPYNSREESV